MTTRICIVRHGETDWNLEGRIQGHTDVPLNSRGRAQAMAMAYNAGHHHFSAIYSSDLSRAQETAQALAQREGLELHLLSKLRERHYGIFQGITAAEAATRYPDAYGHYSRRDPSYDFVTGENLLGFAARVQEGIDWMVRHHSGETLCAVSHGGVLDILYRQATSRPLQAPRDFVIPNCALNWFRYDAHGWHLELWADRRHLAQVLGETPE